MDELEKAIERLRAEDKKWTMRDPVVTAILAAWDATREVREAERKLLEAVNIFHNACPLNVRWHNEALRELRKPKPRLIVVLESAGTWSVMDRERRLGASEPWLARFQNRADAEEWAAAQEQRP